MKSPLAILALSALPLLSALCEEAGKTPNTNPNTPEGWAQYSDEPPVRLDTNPQAQGKGEAHFMFATHQQIEVLKRNFDPKAFDKWVEKLKAVRLGMTAEEIRAALSSKTGNAMVTFGCGVIVCFELDDVYFVHGLFDEKGRLKDTLTNPIAITYQTSLRVKSLPKQEGIIEHLGLPK